MFIVGHIPFMESLEVRPPMALTKEMKGHSNRKGLERKRFERESQKKDTRKNGIREKESWEKERVIGNLYDFRNDQRRSCFPFCE